MMSAGDEGQGVVVLRIKRRDLPWPREIRIAQNDGWKDYTNGGPVERNSADFGRSKGPSSGDCLTTSDNHK
jgi:hypothetical protein